MVRSFSVVTRAGVPVEDLFDVSLSIDEHVSSMAHTGEAAVGGITSGTIGLGETVTWRARHFGILFTMSSRITALDRPRRFVDEQVRGPFRSFHHEHLFASDGDETVMTDTLTIGSPILGRVAERMILVPYLRRLIRRRNQHLLASLGVVPRTHPGIEVWPVGDSSPFRRYEATVRIGTGDDVWARASREVLLWKVKTSSGFAVDDTRPVSPGARLTVTARVAGITVHEPVEVAEVVETPTRSGFSYRTLPGHPVTGEEAFIVHRAGDDVFLTIRSLTAPADRGLWRVAYPGLRVAQVVARRRYLRALN